MLDQDKGTAELRAKMSLNCEEQNNFTFQIEAIACSGTYSERYVKGVCYLFPLSRCKVCCQIQLALKNIL